MSLKEIIEVAGEYRAGEIIASFLCSKDRDVESFLKTKTILYEKQGKGRTYLIVSKEDLENRKIILLAYFTLAIKSIKLLDIVSKSRRKKMDGLYEDTEDFSAYLVGQLAKNDTYTNDIAGAEILEFALNTINRSFNLVGGRFTLIECSDNEKVKGFYQKNAFEFLQEEDLIQMIRFLI